MSCHQPALVWAGRLLLGLGNQVRAAIRFPVRLHFHFEIALMNFDSSHPHQAFLQTLKLPVKVIPTYYHPPSLTPPPHHTYHSLQLSPPNHPSELESRVIAIDYPFQSNYYFVFYILSGQII